MDIEELIVKLAKEIEHIHTSLHDLTQTLTSEIRTLEQKIALLEGSYQKLHRKLLILVSLLASSGFVSLKLLKLAGMF
jgi:archaellum component FlaC